MGARLKVGIGIAVILVAILSFCWIQHKKIQSLTNERDKYRNNTESLLTDVEHYKTKDSLNAARVQSLELSVKEFERFRAEDAALIKELKSKNRDLASVNKTQAETIIELMAIPRDTVIIIKDSIQVPAISVHCGDAWFDFEGILTAENFSGTLHNRDSLIVAETVRYKRFLGFLWKTKKIKNRYVDIVSKNPHTNILGIEHVIIEK